jgi:hypothetical protein
MALSDHSASDQLPADPELSRQRHGRCARTPSMPEGLNVEIRRWNDRLREQGRPGSEAIWKTTIPERFAVRTDDIHVAALGARRQGLVMSRAGQRAAGPQDNPASARRGRPEPVQNDQQTRVFGHHIAWSTPMRLRWQMPPATTVSAPVPAGSMSSS